MITSRETLIKNITAQLTGYVGYIRMHNRLNLQDSAVIAKDEFKELLNLLFGLQLVNANTLQANAPGIDLIDTTAKVIVQVSVNDTREKIRHTLKELSSRQQEYQGYHLIFLFIAMDAHSLRNGKAYTDFCPDFITFVHKGQGSLVGYSDILDAETLIKESSEIADDDKLEAIEHQINKIYNLEAFLYSNESYHKFIKERDDLKDKITRQLTGYVGYIRTLNRLNLQDSAVITEDEFKELLNRLYGLQLVNANTLLANAPGIDLIDTTAKVIVQVSVSDTREKIRHTLSALSSRQQEYQGYHLLFLFIAMDASALRKGKDYTADCPDFITFVHKGQGSLVGNSDILDAETLITEISKIADDDKLKAIDHLANKIYNLEAFLHNNKNYQDKVERLETVKAELIDVEKELAQYPTLKILQTLRQTLLNERNQLEEELQQDRQYILDLAKYVTQMRSQEMTKRMEQAIAAINEGDYPKAKRILEGTEQACASIFASIDSDIDAAEAKAIPALEELQLKAKTLMADTAVPIDTRVSETLPLWQKIYAAAVKYSYGDHAPEQYEQLLHAYYDFLKQYAHYPEAIEIQESLLSFRRETKGEEHLIANSLHSIGRIFDKLGIYYKALDYYTQAQTIRDKVSGPNSTDASISYNALGELYYHMHEYEEARIQHEKALDIVKATYRRRDLAQTYNCLGLAMMKIDNSDKALLYFQQALEFYQEGSEPRYEADIALSNINIGKYYLSIGKYHETLEYYNRAKAIFETELGVRHPDTALCYNYLGELFIAKGDYSKALEYLRKAQEIDQRLLPPNHLDSQTVATNIEIANLYKELFA